MDKRSKSKASSNASTTAGAHLNGVAVTIATVIALATSLGAVVMAEAGTSDSLIGIYFSALLLAAAYFLFALKVASQWEKAVILRFGKFHKLAGPGLFWIIPIVDTIPNWIDHRVMVTPFSAEKTLTKDSFPDVTTKAHKPS